MRGEPDETIAALASAIAPDADPYARVMELHNVSCRMFPLMVCPLELLG